MSRRSIIAAGMIAPATGMAGIATTVNGAVTAMNGVETVTTGVTGATGATTGVGTTTADTIGMVAVVTRAVAEEATSNFLRSSGRSEC